MKKITAFLLSGVLVFSMIVRPAALAVRADEMKTPSSVAYSDIGKTADEYVSKRESGLASLETAVFKGDKTLFCGRYGYEDTDKRSVADEQTVYEWGSCSKLLVWVSVMQLYEQGKLDLDEDIRVYLPDGFLSHLQFDTKITLTDLMNHKAGWQETIYEDQSVSEDKLGSLEQMLRKLEPYQAYRPGEHTAYSNWGASLAAYIVERISKMDYAQYVHKNIFAPLGITHTSVCLHNDNNSWVREKREDLKTYCIMENVNESFGTNISWVELYPAGACTGTLDDFTAFAKSFVSDKCPLFENKETRELMLSSTSEYKDSGIAKNCHGLWTYQHIVQTLGHAGNTGGCTSMLQFDPVSGLGMVVMTNEVGETAFDYGLPDLIFGDIEDSEVLRQSGTSDDHDISGVYMSSRGFSVGFAKIFNCISAGCFMPVMKGNDTDTYCVAGVRMQRLTDNMWVQDNGNGMKIFLYETNDNGIRTFETMSTDYVLDNCFWLKAVSIVFVLSSACAALVLLVIRLLKYLRNRNMSTSRKYTNTEKSVLVEQIIVMASGLITFLMIEICKFSRPFAAFSCIMAAATALLSFVNAVYLIYMTVKDTEIRKCTAAGHFIWAVCGIFLSIFIIGFRLYNFWTC